MLIPLEGFKTGPTHVPQLNAVMAKLTDHQLLRLHRRLQNRHGIRPGSQLDILIRRYSRLRVVLAVCRERLMRVRRNKPC